MDVCATALRLQTVAEDQMPTQSPSTAEADFASIFAAGALPGQLQLPTIPAPEEVVAPDAAAGTDDDLRPDDVLQIADATMAPLPHILSPASPTSTPAAGEVALENAPGSPPKLPFPDIPPPLAPVAPVASGTPDPAIDGRIVDIGAASPDQARADALAKVATGPAFARPSVLKPSPIAPGNPDVKTFPRSPPDPLHPADPASAAVQVVAVRPAAPSGGPDEPTPQPAAAQIGVTRAEPSPLVPANGRPTPARTGETYDPMATHPAPVRDSRLPIPVDPQSPRPARDDQPDSPIHYGRQEPPQTIDLRPPIPTADPQMAEQVPAPVPSATPSATAEAPDGVTVPPQAAPLLKQVAQELLVLATSGAEDGSVTIHLQPEDLGSLQFRVTRTGEGLHVHLSVDQPATLDLLRRHAGDLLQDLQSGGFSGTSLSFAERRANDRAQDEDRPRQSGEEPDPPIRSAAFQGGQLLRVSPGTLNLRL